MLCLASQNVYNKGMVIELPLNSVMHGSYHISRNMCLHPKQTGRCITGTPALQGATGSLGRAAPRGRSPTPQLAPRGPAAPGPSLFLPSAKPSARAAATGPRPPSALQRPGAGGAQRASLNPALNQPPLSGSQPDTPRGGRGARAGSPAGEAGAKNPKAVMNPRPGEQPRTDIGAAVAAALEAGDEAGADAALAGALQACMDNPLNPNRRAPCSIPPRGCER